VAEGMQMSGRQKRRKKRTKRERKNRITRAEGRKRIRDASTAVAVGLGAAFLFFSIAKSDHLAESLALAAIIVSGFLASPALLERSGIFTAMIKMVPWFQRLGVDRANRWAGRAERYGAPGFGRHVLPAIVVVVVVGAVIGPDGWWALGSVVMFAVMAAGLWLLAVNLMGAVGLISVMVQTNQSLPRPPAFDWRMALASVLLFGGFLVQWIQSLG